MDCNQTCNMIQKLISMLRQLEITYGYLIQNAPTEDTRRSMELNLLTVRNSLERLHNILNDMELMTPTGETLEQVPAFANFVDAARFAFARETQAIAIANNLLMIVDHCYYSTMHSIIVDQQLNAMRILFVLT